jgi:endogenous inhibitor of DNA gyrase (YacG/DUF329 family)
MPSLRALAAKMLCPDCSSPVKWEKIRFDRSFPCPACGKSIRIRQSYNVFIWVPTVAVVALFTHVLGASGISWLVWTLIGSFPVAFVFLYFVRFVVPPRLEYGDDISLNVNRPRST